MSSRARCIWGLFTLVLTACPDNVDPKSTLNDAGGDKPYEAPAPVMLTPPPGRTVKEGQPTVAFNTTRKVVDMPVSGSGHRKLRASLVSPDGQRALTIALPDDSSLEFAAAGFHLPPVAATDSADNIMLCWNTLTGSPSAYSPGAPDPALGMSLHCREYKDGKLGEAVRIESPTVGCWVRKLLALPNGGGFRLLYKGDDGWFEHNYKNPMHGTYDAIFDGERWSKPKLILPVPDPSVEYEMP